LAFHGHILVLEIDDLMLAVVDIRQGWSQCHIKLELEQMSNLKMLRVDSDSFMLAAVRLALYQVVLQPKLKLRLVEEVMAWGLSTH
jgi:hypothetical protein